MAADPGPVVGIEWVAANLDRVRLVDVRDAWEYEGIGHLPGAVNVPFDAFREGDGGDEGMLPGADRVAALLGGAGITPDDVIVAYDDEHGVFAARVLVTALLYGHDRWHLLDGDYSAWSRTRGTTTAAPDVTPVTYEVSVPEGRPLIDADGVLAAIEDSDAVLVDTRTAEEFADGHIEGAVHLDWRDLVDPDTRGVKDEPALRDVLEPLGITPDRRVVLYCDTARRISHTYVVLRHLEFPRVAFYEGSLTDWRDRGLPLETEG